MAKKMNKVQKDKVRILKPIVDAWNKCQLDCWQVVPTILEGHDFDGVKVKRAVINDDMSLHGILITNIAGIANAYNWTFGIYHDEEDGVYINL